MGGLKINTTVVRTALVSGLLVGSLAGCGFVASTQTPASGGAAALGSQAAAPAAASADACGLITEAEATTALGADPGPATAIPPACRYGQDTDPKMLRVSLGQGAQSQTAFDHLKAGSQHSAAAGGQTYKELSGVGDAAFISASASGGIAFVMKGSKLAQILVQGTDPAGSAADILTTLARHAAGRL